MDFPHLDRGRKTFYDGKYLIMPKITPIHWRTLEKVFLAAGFRFARQKGSHRSYVKAGVLQLVVIPAYDEVPVAVIHNNLKSSGFSEVVCFEDTPIPHGLKSAVRWLIWKMIKGMLRLYLAAETGAADRDCIFPKIFSRWRSNKCVA